MPTQPDKCAGNKVSLDCGCDLNGTFISRTVTKLHWGEVQFAGFSAIGAGQATLQSWSVWTFTSKDGKISASVRSCGGEVPEVCSPALKETYAQGVPDEVWERPGVPREQWMLAADTTSTPNKLTGGPHASFFGVRLKAGLDPFGAFPTTATDPNLVWTDDDGDGDQGTTSVVRAAGGTSTVCGYPFALVPVDPGIRASKIFGGARAIQTVEMTIDACDTLHGSLKTIAADGRVQGCQVGGGGPCTAKQANFLDSQPQTQVIDSATFVLQRVPADPGTCAEVRGATFPP